ncbi:ABC1 kinase family protein [Phocicoccus pinnipedialis]|uniref:Protein kinase domain-containing protein n=1 Tax=Phocicoccus pinnipedialis TaxID=110845 RepID=A0A6V7RFN3_9BACL|nr:AarF/ABC1/UbiB kinase family protein [Jeotgalicoccus pinnipedialis]MBP1939219.1 ubiquinone biosynthesis protein [Jeotgalicoccus pinnipedialis]CAD2076259.1 putative protein kinase UbiB [Jeotgalicoccus pinnipedialis]
MLLKKQIKYLNRFREIAVLFSKSGLGFIIEESGLDRILSLPRRLITKQTVSDEKTFAERIRIFLEEAGPTFIKLGQIASTRGDIIPDNIISELEKLQNHVPPFETEVAKSLIEESLDIKIDEVFSIFEDEPIGSASIGQVHRAVLHDGRVVAIKVQRPDIEKQVRADLEILRTIAQTAENHFGWAEQYQVTSIVDELANAMIDEMDYMIEARSMERLRKAFKDDPNTAFPECILQLTNKTVLTMDYLDGVSIRDTEVIEDLNISTEKLAEILSKTIFTQIFNLGFFHADIHPGNIIVLRDGRLGFIDFGMVGTLTNDLRYNFGNILIGMMQRDSTKVVRSIIRMGVVPDVVDVNDLYREAEILQDKYYDIPLAQLNFSDAVDDLFSITNHYHIRLPKDFTLLGKTLITLEGNIELLSKTFSIIDVAEPFGKKLVLERFNPKRFVETKMVDWVEIQEDAANAAQNLHQFTKGLKNRELPIRVKVDGRKEISKHADKIINRLSFSLVLLSLSILMVGLIIGASILGEGSILFKFPIIEIGSVLAVFMFLWLIYSIFKTGRL